MRTTTVYTILFFISAMTSCMSQKNDQAGTGETKEIVTKYGTLKIETGKIYQDYYDSCKANFSLFWMHIEAGEPEKALAVNDSLIIKYPYYHLPYNRHGAVLLNSLNRYEEAIPWFAIASSLKPDEALYYYNTGLCYFYLKNGPNAIKFFNKTIEINKNAHEAFYMRAYAKELTADFEGALADYTETVRLDPNNDKAYNNMAFVLNELGLYEKAVEACDNAIKIKPGKSGAYVNRGIANYKLGKHENACNDWKQAAELGYDVERFLNEFCK